ncbi:AraC family transcriptional regulator [Pokkaliibacter sp. CJK22405]|uniref:helix-turn-helix transcriptional regulator n=1 Tax=Pokkaliibacter sp. CJK22405 TaxID=3384615 RepID=UPI003984B2FE
MAQRPPASQDVVRYQPVSQIPGLILGEALLQEFEFEPHYHLEMHIGLVTQGVQSQFIRGEATLLGPGKITVMPPGEIHDGRHHQPQAHLLRTFRLAPELLDQLSEELQVRIHLADVAPELLDEQALSTELSDLHSVMMLGDQLSGIVQEGRWLAGMARLFGVSTREDTESDALSHPQWQQVRDYCYAHLHEKITLDQLAALCDLSRYQFLRRFQQSTGMTPHGWLIRLRLEHACLLLMRKDSIIADVAAAVGFYDQSHFNRAFRQAYGVAPSRFAQLS